MTNARAMPPLSLGVPRRLSEVRYRTSGMNNQRSSKVDKLSSHFPVGPLQVTESGTFFRFDMPPECRSGYANNVREERDARRASIIDSPVRLY